MRLLALPLAVLLFPPLLAQSPRPSSSPREGDAAIGLPGARPGTVRWLASLSTRSFDLSAFRAAVQARNASRVETLVKKMERQVLVDQAPFVRFVEGLGGTVVAQFWLVDACAVEVPAKAIAELRKHPSVRFLHPDERCEPVAFIKDATNSKNHNADAMIPQGILGKGVCVAIMDTGCDINMNGSGRPHRSFYIGGNTSNKTGGGIGGSRMLKAVALGRMGADDVHGHGTGVAGIAAGEAWANTASDRGHAPLASLTSYSIANNSAGYSDFTTIAKAWQAIAADRVKYNIVAANNSYSGSYDPLNVSQQALDSVVKNADVLAVTAAGNTSSSTNTSQSNANGLSVGATNNLGRKTMASFSSRGPLYGDTNRFFPDMCANGVSTVMPKRDAESSNFVGSGTSMASPQVCGAAALFRSVHKTANALMTKAAILASTEDVTGFNQTSPYNTRNAYGMGYLRDDALITLAQGKGLLGKGTLTKSQSTAAISFSVTKGKTYAASIAWHRHVFTSKAWSDLDLEVRTGSTVISASKTTRNLYEKCVFLAKTTGTVTLFVSNKSLEIASVPFAYAAQEVPPAYIPGSMTAYGKGCLGTGKTQGVADAAPSQFLKSFGPYGMYMPLGYKPHRMQAIYDSSKLSNTIVATGLAFRVEDRFITPVRNYWVELQIEAGMTKYSPISMSRTFAYNRTGTMTTILKKQKVRLPDITVANKDPLKWDIRIPLDRPLIYKKATSQHLLMDFRNSATSFGTKYAYYYVDYDYNYASPGVTRSYSLLTTSTTGYVTRGYGPILGFTKPNPGGAIPQIESSSVPVIGGSYQLQLRQAKAGSAALLFLGFSNKNWGAIPLPLDLSAAGAAGCSLLTEPSLILTGATDSKGLASFPLGVPRQKALIQLGLYHQVAVLDPTANKLGLAWTAGLHGVVGGQP